MALPVVGATLLGVGLAGSLLGSKKSNKGYREAMSSMGQAWELINKQYGAIEEYFGQAGEAFETQFKTYQSQQMQDAINTLAGTGIYESPVAERSLGRQRQALAETYATAKSQLAGQRLSAISAVDQQKIGYLQNLANLQYQKQLAKQQQQGQLFGTIGGLGGALLGI